jgi:hypothetical protein
MSWLSRFANAFRPSSVDRALDEEAAFHLECRINELIASGLSPVEAEAQARRAFGNRLRLREESRDVKLLPWLIDCAQDVRVAFRVLRAAPIVTGVAIFHWPSASARTRRSSPSSTACCSVRCRSPNRNVS